MHETAWGLLIAIYLFCGGLSAGAMMLSAAAVLFGRGRYLKVARAGALVAPIPVTVGTALLVFDLGRPLFFWKLFFSFAPFSPMWIGSWLLVLFSMVSFAYAYLHVPLAWRRWRVPNAERWLRRLATAGLPLGFSVAVYTAVLLGVLVARPLWNTPVLSLLFVLSALSSGAATLMLLVPSNEHHSLSVADVPLIVLEAIALATLLFFGLVSSESARHAVAVLAGGYALLFWAGVVLLGLAVPFALELRLLRRPQTSPLLGTLAACLVLAGGFLLRYVIVFAGQDSAL